MRFIAIPFHPSRFLRAIRALSPYAYEYSFRPVWHGFLFRGNVLEASISQILVIRFWQIKLIWQAVLFRSLILKFQVDILFTFRVLIQNVTPTFSKSPIPTIFPSHREEKSWGPCHAKLGELHISFVHENRSFNINNFNFLIIIIIILIILLIKKKLDGSQPEGENRVSHEFSLLISKWNHTFLGRIWSDLTKLDWFRRLYYSVLSY